MKSSVKIAVALLANLTLTASLFAQYAPSSFRLPDRGTLDAAPPEPRLNSNVIIDIIPTSQPDRIWLGTGKGLSLMTVFHDLAKPDSFLSYSAAQGVGKGGCSGLLVTDSIIWASFAFDTSVGVSGAGGGLAYSRNQGQSWTWVPQPRDRVYRLDSHGMDVVLGYWPTSTNVDNITYDIAQTEHYVWIASKGGGIRRHAHAADYTDYRDTTGWMAIDTLFLEGGQALPFHPGDVTDGLIHRAFSLCSAEGAIFAGTAAGILKSTNEGRSWRLINAVNSRISGNFVTAMSYQQATHTLWAATWRAESSDEFYAVSKSSDGGQTWSVSLDSAQVTHAIGYSNTVRAHGFAFDDTVVYVCDDFGLWKSVDGGHTWDAFTRFSDASTGRRFYETEIYSALTDLRHRLWAGGTDGLAGSFNAGREWTLTQTAYPLNGAARTADTYAYPTPWSPQRYGPVKLRYKTTSGAVKVSIFDFAMSKVVDLPSVVRVSGEQYEVWDGKKDGKIVANGTYFYKIEKPGGDVWDKLIVLD